MKDLGQALAEKREAIIQDWLNAVQLDPNIESVQKLSTYEAVRNSLPKVLQQLAFCLSKNKTSRYDQLENKSENHGYVRADQGYDIAEIVREYSLLRQILISKLEPDLLTSSSGQVLEAIKTIDDLLDSVIATSLESYIEFRLAEIRQIQGQLSLTNQELTRLIQTQKESISFMAHELKTPLNSIIGFSKLLLKKERKNFQDKDSGTNLDQLERVLRNGQSLLKIINDTLEISRHSEGLIQLELVSINVGELIQEIVEDGLEPLALEKKITLNVDVSQSPPSVVTDPLRIQQIVTNLVSNALRYTDSGVVKVTCCQVDSDSWLIAVEDSGIGISEEDRFRIFDPFIQSESKSKDQESQSSNMSTGLGLAIVQRMVRLLNGTIEVTSNLGEGSTFTVVMPLVISN